MRDDLHDLLKTYEGRPVAVSGRGPDPVNSPMIRHWCEAMGDTDPAYTGPDPVAPPTMLQAWTLAGLGGPGGAQVRPGPYRELMALLEAAGCTAIVATDCEQEYLRPLRPGDVITFDSVIASVSPRKTTRLGGSLRHHAHGDPGERRTRGNASLPLPEVRARRPGRGPPRPPTPRDQPRQRRLLGGRRRARAAHPALRRLRKAAFPLVAGVRRLRIARLDGGTGLGRRDGLLVCRHAPPALPGLRTPYAVGLIELAEGVRMISNIVGVEPERVRVGMPVVLEFVRVDDDLVLPLFRPADEGAV
nr:OB-fold domain-containing protein [Streptomyces griseocarneus]